MILQSLNAYYERLEKDPDGDIAPFGFSRQKISFCIVLEEDGTLFEIQDMRVIEKGKPWPVLRVVPHPGGKRTSGIKPYFLWDKTSYVFGRDIAEEKKGGAKKRAKLLQQFDAFRLFHLEIEDTVTTPSFSAVCRFLESWDPEDVEATLDNWEYISGTNCIFSIRAQTHYVHEQPNIVREWTKRVSASGSTASSGMCLVTGEDGPLTRTHLPIKGVIDPGGQAEKSIVSFNLDAFDSYGQSSDKKSTNFNSRLSHQAAFQYCTALNRLLAGQQRIRIGDATTVYWTEKPTEAENLLPWVFEPSRDAEDEALKNRMHSLLSQIAHGKYPSKFGDRHTPFYVLGLSPSTSRISIRFWWVSTLGGLVEMLSQHFADLEIAGETKADRTSSIQQLLEETVPLKKGWPDREKVSPQLAGQVGQAVLSGQMYPGMLLDKVLYRIRADGFVDVDKHKGWRKSRHRRAAILKAYVNRYFRLQRPQKKEHSVDTYLNKLHPNPAYQCGRLMGVLAFVQERALNKVNSSIVRRFLSAVSSAPALHLGRLQVQAEVGHLPKLEGDLPSYLRDEMKQINVQLQDSLPSSLNRIGQSLFVLGFYQELMHLERTSPNVDRKRNLHIRRTDAGEWVRSLGEQQVANCLFQLGINYFYEPRAVLCQGPNRYPDFFVPGGSEATHSYIEYLGMNTPEYNARWEEKIKAYRATGITENGGDYGHLFIIDCREERWDDTQMLSQLQKWFQVETIETSSNTSEKE